jgi:hypothetical protein
MRMPRHLAAAIGVASVAQRAPAEACAMMTPHGAIQPNHACEQGKPAFGGMKKPSRVGGCGIGHDEAPTGTGRGRYGL